MRYAKKKHGFLFVSGIRCAKGEYGFKGDRRRHAELAMRTENWSDGVYNWFGGNRGFDRAPMEINSDLVFERKTNSPMDRGAITWRIIERLIGCHYSRNARERREFRARLPEKKNPDDLKRFPINWSLRIRRAESSGVKRNAKITDTTPGRRGGIFLRTPFTECRRKNTYE